MRQRWRLKSRLFEQFSAHPTAGVRSFQQSRGGLDQGLDTTIQKHRQPELTGQQDASRFGIK
jgi:hypothetical protein